MLDDAYVCLRCVCLRCVCLWCVCLWSIGYLRQASGDGGRREGVTLAFGALTPIDHFGLVDGETMIGVGGQTWHFANGAIDIEHGVTTSTNQMVMVVAHSVFVSGGEPRRLDAAHEVLLDEDAERVVHSLARNRPDHCSHIVGQLVGGRMPMNRDGSHNGEALSGDLHAVLAQQLFNVAGHLDIQTKILDMVKYWIKPGYRLSSNTQGSIPMSPMSSAHQRVHGSQTEANLRLAFARESEANLRYLYFAQKADIEGYPEIAALFRTVADSEIGHAHGHLEYLATMGGDPATGMPMGDTADNLAAAIAGETDDHIRLYPGFAECARQDGFSEIADWFDSLARAEESHAVRLAEGLNAFAPHS